MHLKNRLLLSTFHPAVAAFDNKAGWKMDGDKIAVDSAGNPIFLRDDGTEMTIQTSTVVNLQAEAKNFRLRAEKAESTLKQFEGLDPEKAKTALDIAAKIDQKKLIDAGEVDKVKQEIANQYQAQAEELRKANLDLTNERDNLIKRTAFQASAFIKDRVAVPPEMFESVFGKNFKVIDGRVVPHGIDGNPIYSKKNYGEIANVDEAFEIMVEGYAYKDQILKAASQGGSGSAGNGAGRGAAGRTIKRSDFEQMSPMDKANAAKECTIVD